MKQDEKPKQSSDRGLECPSCGCRHHSVVRTSEHRLGIRRIRQCRHCGRRFGTWEKR